MQVTDKKTPEVSIFRSATAIEHERTATLLEVLKAIKSGEWKDQVEKLRRYVKVGHLKTYAKAKKNLPAVTISGVLPSRRKVDGITIKHNGYLQGDFDAKDHPGIELDDIRSLVNSSRYVKAGFISPSGEGYKALISIPADPELHKRSFIAAEAHFASLGLKLDPSTKDPKRLCFVSYDPELYLRKEKADCIEPVSESKAAQSSFDGLPSLETTEADIKEMLSFIPPRPDYDDWLKIASAVWSVLDESTGCALLNAWSPEENNGEYRKKHKARLRDVGIGTLAWYAQAHGFDCAKAARAKMWAGRIRFAQKSTGERPDGSRIIEPANVLEAPKDADSPQKVSDIEGIESFDNPEFVQWCLRHEQRGDAALWNSKHEGEVCYDYLIRAWRRFNGGVWKRDESNTVTIDFADELSAAYESNAKLIAAEIKAHPFDGNPKKDPRLLEIREYKNRIKKLNTSAWLSGGISLAAALPTMAKAASDFDQNPDLFAVQNGVVDFRTGEFRESRPSDLLATRSLIRFDPDAKCPAFDDFLFLTMQGDEELIDYLWRAIGYSLTGSVDQQVLFFSHGGGSNGKSTFSNVLRMLVGDYSTSIKIDALLGSRSDNATDYQLASLHGKRVVMADEIPKDKRLNEGVVKSITGGESIVARNPYEKPYEFMPTHKLWLAGNHKPKIIGTDHGIWRRIHLIPWMHQFTEESKRPFNEVIKEFRDELPGILNAAIAGFIDYTDRGQSLDPPEQVMSAVRLYRCEEDAFGRFLEERVVPRPNAEVLIRDIKNAFLAWCEDQGESPNVKTVQKVRMELVNRKFAIEMDRCKRPFIMNYEIVDPE